MTFLTCIITAAFHLSGCLKENTQTTSSSANPTPSTSPTIVELGFAGVASVQNTNGNEIKISWDRSANTSIIGYRIYEVKDDGSLNAVKQVDASKSAFLHTGLVLGSSHSYLVKAIDKDGNYDGNTVIKSTFTYGGISSVVAASQTSATVYFNPPTGAIKATIYYKARREGTWAAAGAVTDSSSTSYVVTGLKTGTTYDFKVHAVDASGDEDSNPVVQSLQTASSSFNPPTPLVAKYKGFILAQAFGLAPGAPVNPKVRQVNLTWASFNSNVLTTVNYSLVRVASGGVLDITTTTACSATTTTSCRVCQVSGTSENKSCTDENVGAPPAVYDYVVTMHSATNWPEELPSSGSDADYRTTVHIPPDNMVLVHRDSVNYELCNIMGKSSSIDPLHKQRCQISGSSMVGSTPYNTSPDRSPLNLNSGYFDFGYNLFIDRWEMACNWTPKSNSYTGQTTENTGMCLEGNLDGDCYGTTDPGSTKGKIGNVFYNTSNGKCLLKTTNTTWVQAGDSSLASADRAKMITINPGAQGGRRPPLVLIQQDNSQATCSSLSDTNYGTKRLLRKREWTAAAGWAKFQGEPNYLTDTAIATIETGSSTGAHTSLYQCNTTSHYGITTGSFGTSSLTSYSASSNPYSFVIGSLETSNCVSRFGAQDMVGNVWEWNSDQMYCNNTASTISTPYNLPAYSCVGTQSPLDSGNGFSSGFDMNGFTFDSTKQQGPSGSTVTEWNYEAASFSANYFNVPLALPLIGNDNGNALNASTNATKLHGDRFFILINSGNSTRGIFSGGNWGVNFGRAGRWSTFWGNAPNNLDFIAGLRCALPAE